VTLYTEGFSRFVTSTTAPIATGRSESCRVGLSPTGKSRLSTAHVEDGFDISQKGERRVGYLKVWILTPAKKPWTLHLARAI
jgi:hypothetical protein